MQLDEGIIAYPTRRVKKLSPILQELEKQLHIPLWR